MRNATNSKSPPGGSLRKHGAPFVKEASENFCPNHLNHKAHSNWYAKKTTTTATVRHSTPTYTPSITLMSTASRHQRRQWVKVTQIQNPSLPISAKKSTKSNIFRLKKEETASTISWHITSRDSSTSPHMKKSCNKKTTETSNSKLPQWWFSRLQTKVVIRLKKVRAPAQLKHSRLQMKVVIRLKKVRAPAQLKHCQDAFPELLFSRLQDVWMHIWGIQECPTQWCRVSWTPYYPATQIDNHVIGFMHEDIPPATTDPIDHHTCLDKFMGAKSIHTYSTASTPILKMNTSTHATTQCYQSESVRCLSIIDLPRPRK